MSTSNYFLSVSLAVKILKRCVYNFYYHFLSSQMAFTSITLSTQLPQKNKHPLLSLDPTKNFQGFFFSTFCLLVSHLLTEAPPPLVFPTTSPGFPPFLQLFLLSLIFQPCLLLLATEFGNPLGYCLSLFSLSPSPMGSFKQDESSNYCAYPHDFLIFIYCPGLSCGLSDPVRQLCRNQESSYFLCVRFPPSDDISVPKGNLFT